jgi:hypothetical protein
MSKQELQAAVKAAETNLAAAKDALTAFESQAENNVFESLPKALSAVEDKLLEQARQDCEGAYNCGADYYDQEFIVDGVRYLGTLTVEYNRHDKTYYYIDGSSFNYKTVESADNET